MKYRLLAALALIAAPTAAVMTAVSAASAAEVNVYSYRQGVLVKPLFDAFTKETGVKVNVVFAKKGLIKRLQAEGRNSPADLVFTVDIGRLAAVVNAGLAQPVKTADTRKGRSCRLSRRRRPVVRADTACAPDLHIEGPRQQRRHHVLRRARRPEMARQGLHPQGRPCL